MHSQFAVIQHPSVGGFLLSTCRVQSQRCRFDLQCYRLKIRVKVNTNKERGEVNKGLLQNASLGYHFKATIVS